MSDRDDRKGGSSSRMSSADSTFEDAQQARLERRFDELRLKAEVERLEQVGAQIRERESLCERYYKDVTLPASDELGVVIGQLREAVAGLDGNTHLELLIDKLETAVADQVYVLLRHFYGSNDVLLQDTLYGKRLQKAQEEQTRRRGMETDENTRATQPQPTAMAATAASDRPTIVKPVPPRGQVPMHKTESFRAHPPHTRPAAAADLLGSLPYFFSESLAKCIRCERVRFYMAADDKLGVVHVTSFPQEPPAPLPPSLPRALLSSVFFHGIAVSGRDATTAVSSGQNQQLNHATASKGSFVLTESKVGSTKKTTAAVNALSSTPSDTVASPDTVLMGSVAPSIRSALVFPVKIWSADGTQKVAGVIECINKEPGDDEVREPGDNVVQFSGGDFVSNNSSCNGRQFTLRDEECVFTASLLLGALMERYPQKLFHADPGPVLSTLLNPWSASSHLLPVLDLGIPSASATANRSLRAPPWVYIYRGPLSVVRRFPISEQGGSIATTLSAGEASVNAANDLRSVEESIDCLSAMWKRAYEDNVKMHEHCRRLQDELREARRISDRFLEAMETGRTINSVRELHDYLRAVELTVKTGRVAEVDRVLTGWRQTARSKSDASVVEGDGSGITTPPSDAPHRPVTPIAELHYDGPSDVRPYTVDPFSRRAQLAAIQKRYEDEAAKAEADECRRLAAIPAYSRDTAGSKRRRRHAVMPPYAAAVASTTPRSNGVTPFRIRPVGL